MPLGRIARPLSTLVLFSTGLLADPGYGVSFRPPAGALVAPGKAADVTLLYTGDALGYVDPCG